MKKIRWGDVILAGITLGILGTLVGFTVYGVATADKFNDKMDALYETVKSIDGVVDRGSITNFNK